MLNSRPDPRSLTCRELQEALPRYFSDCLGDPAAEFSRISPPENATPDSIVFAANPKALEAALSSPARVLVLSPKATDSIQTRLNGKTALVAANVELAMALTARQFFFPTPYRSELQSQIHKSATIDSSAELAPNVQVGPHAVVGPRVKIGAGSFIGANSVIEADANIGENTTIHPLVYIGHSVVIGNQCEIHPHSTIGKEGYGYAHDEKGNHYKIPHQGRVVLEDDVHIGAGCALDRGTFGETRIGSGTKLDNQCHIAHNVKIGRNGLITAQFVVAGSSQIGNYFIAGGKTAVAGHIKITDGVNVAGLSAIRKSIDKPGPYGGNPLQPLQDSTRTLAALTHLHDIRQHVSRLMKKVFPEGTEKDTESRST